MYDKLITKMINNFSEVGCIFQSKACNYSGIYEISDEDIMMYYKLLKSNKFTPPAKICKNNHIACCLFYLSKEKEEYKEEFLDRYLRNISFNNLPVNETNLISLFNIIEFDKTYLNSPEDHILFLYQLLKGFSNFPTNFQNYILYKYFRGYLKFRMGEYDNANKEYFEIVSELFEQQNPNYIIKYIKLKNNLLKVNLYRISKKTSHAEYHEYWEFLKELFDEVKKTNKILALKLGFDLYSTYFEGKNYNGCIPLLVEMKQLLKKELLKGTTLKNGIDYYLSIASRLGYIGLLLDNQKAMNSAIKKIRKTLDIIKNDKNNEKLKQIVKVYSLVLAILEVGLTKRTNYDLLYLASDFQNNYIPKFDLNMHSNYIITKQNKENIIVDLKIINNMNDELTKSAKSILTNNVNQIQNNNYSNPLFYTFIMAVHDKINRYANSYITDTNEKMRKFYKSKIKDYHDGAINIINMFLVNDSNDSIIYTKYIKNVIIDIISAYAHILIYENNMNQLKATIIEIDKLKSKIKFEENHPSYALINKIKGDYWFFNKDYKSAINYYERALTLFEKDNPKIAPILFNNGCAYFFMGNKAKTIEYLNRCINEYNNLIMQKNIYGFTPDKKTINEKINKAKNLLNQLS